MEHLFKKLNEIINEYDNFILMGHKDPDLDSLGSCLGMTSIIDTFDKKSYIFLNESEFEKYNSNVNQALLKTKQKFKYVNSENYSEIKGNTLLMVLDVHILERLEYPEIIDKYDVVVIDHHIKSKNYIKETKFMYIDTNLSSMSELITFYAEYNNVDLDTTISTILLAGIEIDTNGFNLKTTSSTYEAASTLMEMGADSILKQELLKETKEEYMKRANFIRTSFMINDNIAMCIVSSIVDSKELSEIAEELLTFADIEVSYVIGKLSEDTVGISAKSLGEIDVSSVIEKLNGGGHSSNAAAQIKDKSIKEVKQEIIELLK